MKKDFWHKSTVAVLGGGSWGTVLAELIAKNVQDVRFWVRNEERARAINATRLNERYTSAMPLSRNIVAMSSIERVFEGGVQAIIWALPSEVCRAEARRIAPLISGEEVILHATKGIESGSLKRVSEILKAELPSRRIGVISGPNLSAEIQRGDPSATVVASNFEEVIEAGRQILTTSHFRVYGSSDVVGVEWAGTLKNILAIAAGALDALKLGWNTRALLYTRGIAEMSRFGTMMGADARTFQGLAGAGDVIATCSSPTSRNYRVGIGLASGKSLAQVLEEIGSTAEGVRTARTIYEFAHRQGLYLPINAGVYAMIEGQAKASELMAGLMVSETPEREF